MSKTWGRIQIPVMYRHQNGKSDMNRHHNTEKNTVRRKTERLTAQISFFYGTDNRVHILPVRGQSYFSRLPKY
jgi:hypothetical protein